jgi:crotonobetainyl-CoA:carnitine CoA-transferase CaiB-like acyl-CoA transferase
MAADLDRMLSVVTDLGLPSPVDRLSIVPTADLYGSPFAVTEAAAAAVASAVWAVAAFDAERRGATIVPATVDARHAAVAIHSERFLRVPDLAALDLRHPVSGNYRTADGWIRLHTNLQAHLRAALGVLGAAADRSEVARATAVWPSLDLEQAVIDAGGVAGAMRTTAEWRAHPQADAVLGLPLVGRRDLAAGGGPHRPGPRLDGIRVLDLTRVIAGPVAGRFLASFGADVLRVDPPLDDGLAVEIDTSVGKRRTSLDLRDLTDRRSFDALLANADVLLSAFRPGALDRLGYDPTRLQSIRPGLVVGRLSAYGGVGPWHDRRGFDSVVQLVTGLAHACGFTSDGGPDALPAQALDHATGYLLAAGVVAGLVHRQRTGSGHQIDVALARTADWLRSFGTVPERPGRNPSEEDAAPYLTTRSDTHWGAMRHVRTIGRGAHEPFLESPPPPRDAHPAAWRSASQDEAPRTSDGAR